MTSKILIPALFLLPWLATPALAADDQPTGTIVLNETCWLRQYYRFGVNRYSARALKSEGAKVLGQTGLDRTRRETEELMIQRGLDPGQSGLARACASAHVREFSACDCSAPSTSRRKTLTGTLLPGNPLYCS